MRDRMSEIFWHPVTAASRAPRFPTTWPRNDGLWGREWICTGREKEKSNRLTINFVRPFRVRSTTKNKREKKSYKTKNSDDDDDNKLLNDLVSPEKNNKKKKLSANLLSTASVSTKDFDCDIVAGRRFFLDGGIPFQIKNRQISFSWGRKGFEVHEAGWVYLCSYQGLFQAIKGFVSLSISVKFDASRK